MEFSRQPFQYEVDTAFFYQGGARGNIVDDIKNALAEDVPLITLTGTDGSGKTMICRKVQQDLGDQRQVLFFEQGVESFDEVVEGIASLIQNDQDDTASDRNQRLNRFIEILRDNGRRLIIIIDGAESIFLATLERIRRMVDLANGETTTIQLILSGQPLFLINFKQLGIVSFKDIEERNYSLDPLDAETTYEYLNHSIAVAAEGDSDYFSPRMADRIMDTARGNFRLINRLADRYVTTGSLIDPEVEGFDEDGEDEEPVIAVEENGRIQSATRLGNVDLDFLKIPRLKYQWYVAAGAVIGLILVAFLLIGGDDGSDEPVTEIEEVPDLTLDKVEPDPIEIPDTVEQPPPKNILQKKESAGAPVVGSTSDGETDTPEIAPEKIVPPAVAEDQKPDGEQEKEALPTETAQTPSQDESSIPDDSAQRPVPQEDGEAPAEETIAAAVVEQVSPAPSAEQHAEPEPSERVVEKQETAAPEDEVQQTTTPREEADEAADTTETALQETPEVEEPLTEPPSEQPRAATVVAAEVAAEVPAEKSDELPDELPEELSDELPEELPEELPDDLPQMTEETAVSGVSAPARPAGEGQQGAVVPAEAIEIPELTVVTKKKQRTETVPFTVVTLKDERKLPPEIKAPAPVPKPKPIVQSVEPQKATVAKPVEQKPASIQTQAVSPPPEPPAAPVVKQTRPVAQTQNPQAYYSERLAAGSRWLVGGGSGKYTVQLMVMQSDQAEKSFGEMLGEAGYQSIKDQTYLLRKAGQPQTLTLYFGEFNSREEAQQAQLKLPQFLQDMNPSAVAVNEAVTTAKNRQ